MKRSRDVTAHLPIRRAIKQVERKLLPQQTGDGSVDEADINSTRLDTARTGV
jgi:hypothetical protein